MFASESSNLFSYYSNPLEYEKIKKLNSNIENIQNLTSLDFSKKEHIKEYYEGYTENEIIKAIENGFEVSLDEGPLCGESMFGCIFIVENFTSTKFEEEESEKEPLITETKPNITLVKKETVQPIYVHDRNGP